MRGLEVRFGIEIEGEGRGRVPVVETYCEGMGAGARTVVVMISGWLRRWLWWLEREERCERCEWVWETTEVWLPAGMMRTRGAEGGGESSRSTFTVEVGYVSMWVDLVWGGFCAREVGQDGQTNFLRGTWRRMGEKELPVCGGGRGLGVVLSLAQGRERCVMGFFLWRVKFSRRKWFWRGTIAHRACARD
jgi:hypothetical protein